MMQRKVRRQKEAHAANHEPKRLRALLGSTAQLSTPDASAPPVFFVNLS
jgi:hypothetical protein